MQRVSLPEVTLCCVDSTARLPWALQALQRCLDQIEFGAALLFSDAQSLGQNALPGRVRWIEIEPLRTIEAYSAFMLKSLAAHVHTSHVLIVQWDGFVLNARAWRDAYLHYDYIGAPWHHLPGPWVVGNGGFSLRSLRLLTALQDPAFAPHHPEDICICRTHRAALQQRGLCFAPLEIAQQFAVEEGTLTSEIFGFHGAQHLPSVLPPEATLALVASFDESIVTAHAFGGMLRELTLGVQRDARLTPALAAFERLIARAVQTLRAGPWTSSTRGVCKALIRYGQFDAAQQLLQGRAEPRLRLRLHLRRFAACL